jgi:hypothetical protein
MKKNVLCFGLAVFFLADFFAAPAVQAQTTVSRSYYVNAVTGNDANNGRSEDRAYKTMDKALEMAKMGVVKTITVIGAIDGFRTGDVGKDEILITGKPDASQAEKAKINGAVSVGSNSNISFAYITIENQEGYGIHGGNVTLGQDVVVQNCKTGVYEVNLFLTHNAMITGCTEYGVGWADSVTMTDDSSITNCGIGITSSRSTLLLLSDNAKISGNEMGGVRGDSTTLTLSDNAEISNNGALGEESLDDVTNGGDMYINKLVMNVGWIIDNTTTAKGGGVYYRPLTVEGSAETGSRTNGGGVNVRILVMNGGRIINNTATGNGGGVYCRRLEMTGGEISGNRAVKGGGVFVAGYSDDESVLSGGTISGNKAEYGAGVYIGKQDGQSSSAPFTLSGGSISGNEAEFVGGGVYVESGGKYTATGGTVENNTAGDGAGHDVFNQ